MTSPRRLETDLPAVLADLYLAGIPDYRDDIVRQTAATRQRPAWTFPERWLPMDLVTKVAPGAPRIPWRAIGALAVLALLVAALLAAYVGSQRRLPSPFGPAANGVMMYSRDGDIYTIDAVGDTPRLLVGGPLNEQLWGISRQGTQLAFLRSAAAAEPSTLWVIGVDGSGQRQLDGAYWSVGTVDWSPNGDALAVGYRDRGLGRIAVVPTDGSAAAKLDLTFEATQPTWRPPDGQQLSFRGRDSAAWGQFLIDRDGSDVTRLDLPSEHLFLTEYDVRDATWSADGRRLLYDGLHTVAAGNHSGLRVHVAAVDPSGVVLSDSRYDFEDTADDELNASWLTNDQVVYQRRLGNEEVGIVDSLRIGTLTEGAPTFDLGITSDGGDGVGYEIAPDRTRLIATAWKERRTFLTDLTTRTSEVVDILTDEGATWQRIAIP